ncbi:MAG: hypothetical protein SWZ49_29235 [Cyanobacteriota bacterium]|nr:hypothetical protein [Cyanobacteriota bacterium]
MKLLIAASTLFCAIVATGLTPMVQARESSFSGTVERVWEDGFRLNTGERSVRIDSWDVYGDNTPRNLSKGDRITVNGEFEGGEFDAFSITKSDDVKVRQD